MGYWEIRGFGYFWAGGAVSGIGKESAPHPGLFPHRGEGDQRMSLYLYYGGMAQDFFMSAPGGLT